MSLQAQIQSLAEQFAQSILDAIRGASLDELAGGTRRGPGRPRLARPGRPARAGGGGGKRIRRSTEQLQTTLSNIVELVKKHKDGLRSEQIQAALGLTRKEI